MPTRLHAALAWRTALLLLMVCTGVSSAADTRSAATVSLMRQGGHILVFRSTATEPDQADSDPLHPEHAKAQRPLSRQGREQAAGVGKMLRELRVPTGDTYTSKFKRAMDTAKLAGFGPITPLDWLTEAGVLLSPAENEHRAEWFRHLLRERPQRGANVVVVADRANIADAIGAELWGLEEGELVLVRPDMGTPLGFSVIGRLTLRELRAHWLEVRGSAK